MNGTNVTVVKAALQLLGEDCGATRPPSAWPLTETQMAGLKKQLQSWGIKGRKPSRKREQETSDA